MPACATDDTLKMAHNVFPGYATFGNVYYTCAHLQP